MQHSVWHKIPMVRILVPLICGVSTSMFYETIFFWNFAGFLVCFFASICVHCSIRRYAYRWVFGALINICIFLGGLTLHTYQDESKDPLLFHHLPGIEWVLVKVTEQPAVKPTSYKMVVESIAVADSSGRKIPAKGKLMVYMQKGIDGRIPRYGEVLAIPSRKIKEINGPQNPDEFDYKKYLAFRQIYYQAYLQANKGFTTAENLGNPFISWAYQVQYYFKRILSVYIASAKETAVAEALLYGYDDDIDVETVQAYSHTGTLHVLAVSGMHVGIIFMILGLVLAPLKYVKRGKLIRQLIILVMLWVYSLLCGLSPSILRATVMFSFLIIADLLNVRSGVYNTLAASAFVLLCYDANILANAGFQLSYLAVFGIVFFQPFIADLYTAPNWFMHQVWSVSSVSLAAQLITFPIGLLYFHQFPNYFLLSNLLIIPLTTAILYAGILLLCISKMSWLSMLLGKLIFVLIYYTNELVKLLERMPYAYSNGICITIGQSVLLYVVIFLVTGFLVIKRSFFLKAGLCCWIVYAGIAAETKIRNHDQQRLMIYQVHKQNAVQWIVGCNSLLIADSALIMDHAKIAFHLQQHFWRSGICDHQLVYADTVNWQKMKLGNHLVLFTGSGTIKDSVQCNTLLIKNDLKLEPLIGLIQADRIIITSAVKPAKASAMVQICRDRNIDAKYVGEKGAIQLSLLK